MGNDKSRAGNQEFQNPDFVRSGMPVRDVREQTSVSATNSSNFKNVDINKVHKEGHSNANGPDGLDSEEQHRLIF